MFAAKGIETEVTLHAVPAASAKGKAVTMKDPSLLAVMTEQAVFDEYGTAVVKLRTRRIGQSTLTFGIEGEALTFDIPLYAVNAEDYASIMAAVEPTPVYAVPGDFNGDMAVTAADAVLLSR